MNVIDQTLQHVLAETPIPSVSLNVQVAGQDVYHRTLGMASLHPPVAALDNQPYDLASLTKPLVGSTLAATLLEQGRLALDQPVRSVLAQVDPRITLAHLLTHSAGLPAHHRFYQLPTTAWGLHTTRRQVLERAKTTRVACEPGTVHRYTDIGFMILCDLIETRAGSRLDQLFFSHIMQPTGVRDLAWGWPMAAATERCPVRGRVIVGTVHDLNAACMGGISAHAGLFGTARAVSTLGSALIDAVQGRGPSGLPGKALGTLWTLPGPGSHVGGWDTPSATGYTSTGSHFPQDGVGHLGYTGTSLWMSPGHQTVVTLLTNRVHPADDLTHIRKVRPMIHNAVAQFLGWAD